MLKLIDIVDQIISEVVASIIQIIQESSFSQLANNPVRTKGIQS